MATRGRFDIVVRGGGTAGCVLVARLSEQPERSVLSIPRSNTNLTVAAIAKKIAETLAG